ncbi:MAG: class I SAM-dependent methyltransferase [Nostocoides sp.]
MFRAFLHEQDAPELFYGSLARDTVALLRAHEPLHDRLVVDVGAGEPQFCEEFQAAGARYLAVDLDRAALNALPAGVGILGRGEALPLADSSADVVVSSNVAEHVRDPGRLGNEMIRIARPGGLIFLAYTSWASPWGGHETSPWHWLGGDYAARRYERRTGRAPKNRFGVNMFPTSVRAGLRWANAHPDAWLIEAFPRYHPDWASGVLALPGAREVATWNLTMLLRRR